MDYGSKVFDVDLLERYAAKGHGVVTCMAAGNDVTVWGTSQGWIIRHDFGSGESYGTDLSGGRTGEQTIHRVFVDPGGSHCIATIVGDGGAETFYIHAKWNKPRVLSKLKGLTVNAVAWNRQQITEASTREIVLGTDNGQLYEMAVDEKDKREKYIKLLFELRELSEAFTGLQMETAQVSTGTRYYVMAVTPRRLYSFTGIGSLEVTPAEKSPITSQSATLGPHKLNTFKVQTLFILASGVSALSVHYFSTSSGTIAYYAVLIPLY